MSLRGFLGLAQPERRVFLLKQMPKNAICAEIGVWRGEFSREIGRRTRPRELHLVDPWLFMPSFPTRWYGGKAAKDQVEMDEIYQSVCARFADQPQVVVHRRKSMEAVASFTDGYFDWIYIDGDHSYEAVKEDLSNWTQKVKQGGFVTGDDYTWRDENNALPVRRAVDEFVAARNISDCNIRDGQFIMKV
jgi:hypothetical protein